MKFLVPFFVAVFVSLSPIIALAQSSSTEVRCPVLTITGSGKYFTRAAPQFKCFASQRAAQKSGLVRAQRSAVVSLGLQASGQQDGSCLTPTPTPTQGPERTLTLSGRAGGASEVFIIRSLPAVVNYTYQGGATDSFSILLHDSSTGYVRSQLAYKTGVGSNAAVISTTGIYYLEIKAAQNMSWSISLSYH